MTAPQFRFRLESVRSVRKHTEDAAAQEMAAAMRRQRETELELERADERIAEARSAILDGRAGLQSGTEMIAVQAWLECAEQAREVMVRNLRRDEHEVRVRREALTEAAGERRALDILEGRHREVFEREAARVEVLTLDEIATARYTRRAA